MSAENIEFEYTCPNCGRQLSGLREWIGLKTDCPHCNQEITIQENNSLPIPPMPPIAPSAPAVPAVPAVPSAPSAPAAPATAIVSPPPVPVQPAVVPAVAVQAPVQPAMPVTPAAAMYICPQCGKQYADQLQHCPFCQNPRARSRKKDTASPSLTFINQNILPIIMKYLVPSAVIAMLVFGVYSCTRRSNNEKLYLHLLEQIKESERAEIKADYISDVELYTLSLDEIKRNQLVPDHDDIKKEYPFCDKQLRDEAIAAYSKRANAWQTIEKKRAKLMDDSERRKRAEYEVQRRKR